MALVDLLSLLFTRDLPAVALVITFFTTLFTKKKLNFWTNAPFHKFYMIYECYNPLLYLLETKEPKPPQI